MSEQKSIMDKLIEKQLRDIESGKVLLARQNLRGALSGGPGESSSPDHFVYAAAKAFCIVYEQQTEKGSTHE